MGFDRLNILKKYYNEEPGDPFNAYALALEYMKHDILQAKELFQRLLAHHPDYLPTYYHAAHLFADEGDIAKALAILDGGMELAKKLGDGKTLRELKSFHDELSF